jgi:capsular exopolysaccharide synthesis family protein
MRTPAPPPKRAIIDAADLRAFARVVARNWYILAIALVLSALLSYLYSYKLPEVYGASTQILLKDREVYDYQNQVYQNIGYIGAYGDIVNQKRVLTSYDLVAATLEKLDFDVSYYITGRLKTTEIYGSAPFTVHMKVLDPRLYERSVDLRILDTARYELRYDLGSGVVVHTFPFDKDVKAEHFVLNVERSAQVRAENIDRIKQSEYQFVLHTRAWLVNKYKSSLTIENLDYTSILELRVEDEKAVRAKMFLDTLSREYINYTLQSEFDINENTITYIDRQLEEVTSVLGRHEDELQSYKENKDILDLNREEQRFFEELVRFDNQRRQVEMGLESINALEDYVLNIGEEKLLPPSFYILEGDAFLKQTLNELYTMQMDRNRMLFEATPEITAVQQLDATIQLHRANLLIYIKNTREAMKLRIGEVGVQVADYERLIRNVPQSQRDILNIERKVQVNEKLFTFLLEKRANTEIARAGIIPQTKVIESARSLGVVRPDKPRILYTFLVGGGVLALGLIFLRVVFYDRLENAEELKALTQVPVFGEIIHSETVRDHAVAVEQDPKAAVTESFRAVRTNLEYLPLMGNSRIVLVTSYRPNEGKTFCSVNLAAILAFAGKKVLLLELDLHKPKVGESLRLRADVGLSTVLVGHTPIAEAVRHTHISGFDVMLSGPLPPNASELVLSPQLEAVFQYGRAHYDYVLVDSPPVGLITDALVMMKKADATLFVLNTRFANKDHVQNAVNVHAESGLQNFGFILNGVRMKRSKYYYNANYGYGYRYASGYGYGRSARGPASQGNEQKGRA